jgi:CRISPR-associated protein Cas1
MELIVEGPGLFVSKHQGRLRVSRDRATLNEAPLLHLRQVVLVGKGIGISSDAVRACSEEGIPVHFLSSSGTAVAGLYAAGLTGTVATRRAQLMAYTDRRGVELARQFVLGKLENQAALLRYMAKYRREAHPQLHGELELAALELRDGVAAAMDVSGQNVEEVRERLMGIEGDAAAHYWAAIGRVVPAALDWPGRETRGATDPLNSALNYGYGVLYAQVEQALVLAGLDPYAGFLHADRPGKPSLVLDLIEEVRQTVVDRTVIGLVNRGMVVEQDAEGRLTETIRRRLAEKVLERLAATEPYEGRRRALRHILQSQARHIATYVRGEREGYAPFVATW